MTHTPAAPRPIVGATPEALTRATQCLTGVLFLAALAGTYFLYQPGLSGGYLFDDFQNLGALEPLKSNPTLDQLVQFLLHGISSPTGRPVTLASFAMQAHDWPENPAGFLRVNLLIHLLNGALLFWWLLRLTRLLGMPGPRGAFVALASTVLWLVAPIQVTAVIYIVQRMTELSATFVFLGMLLYLTGRAAALQGSGRAGIGWMSLGLVVGTGVGMLAKENAVLMPLLVLALEFTLLAAIPRPAFWRAWAILFLAVPTATVTAYLAFTASGVLDAYAMRTFTLGERLMTEARVLFMYLHKVLVPWPSGIRLLYDDLPTSVSLLRPWTTLPAVLGIAALAGLGVALRRRAPLPAFAILWFFAAHLLESTVIPLELAFEHRNYQASVGIWVAIAAGMYALWQRGSSRAVRVTFAGLAAAYALLLCSVTFQIATLWGQPFQMAVWWAEKLPGSKRAQIELVGAFMERGHSAGAVAAAERAAARWPDNAVFHLTLLQLSCVDPAIPPPPVPEIEARVRATTSEILTAIYLTDRVMTLMEAESCAVVPPGTLRQIVDAALANPKMQMQKQNLLLLYSRALKREKRRAEASEYFRLAIEERPVMILLIQAVLDEVDAGRIDRARAYLRQAESDPRIAFRDRWSHRNDLRSLESLLALHESERAIP